MDFVAEMLTRELERSCLGPGQITAIRPPLPRLFRRLPIQNEAFRLNGDRALGRFLQYPALLLASRKDFDLFHVTDHSYGQLVNVLPRSRTGVYVHDLNAFESILEPQRVPRPAWFRGMARATLRGIQRAALVFTSTQVMKNRIAASGIADPARIVCAPYGVAAEYSAAGSSVALPQDLHARLSGRRYVLHVGSQIFRKRLDILFRVFAALGKDIPDLLLVQQGAILTPEQEALIRELGIGNALIQPPRLPREALAALYRGASLTVVPSEDEGFGLPVIEALACGSPVLASDLPTLREAGGQAALYCPVADVPTWVEKANELLSTPLSSESQSSYRKQAEKFTWGAHARIIWESYARLL